MASKRNSRVFTDEATHHEKGQPKNNTSTYRSRRNSRSSGKEELAVQTQGEGEEVKPGGSSIRESIAVVRSQTMAVNKEASVISATMSQTKGKLSLPHICILPRDVHTYSSVCVRSF